MKKGDFILIAVIAAISVLLFFTLKRGAGKTVTVKQDNKTVYEGALFLDKEIKLSGNHIVIKDGYAVMENADCKNQICVHTGKISKAGESIICLPNKVSVTIE